MNYFSFPLSMNLRQALFLLLFLVLINHAKAQEQKNGLEVYGYVKADIGYNFNQIDPNWFDVLRVTKLPRFKNHFAPDGKMSPI